MQNVRERERPSARQSVKRRGENDEWNQATTNETKPKKKQ